MAAQCAQGWTATVCCFLSKLGSGCCHSRYYAAVCMTDRLAALELLADEDSPARSAALQHFHDTYRDQPLAMLKWLYVQVRGLTGADACGSAAVCWVAVQSCWRGQHSPVYVPQPGHALVCVTVSFSAGCQ